VEPVDEATRKAAFAAHAREQQRAWLRLTYRQRLDWLWQAKLFAARALQAAEERRAGKARSSGER
jgi:hypothetical protein